MVIDAGCGGLRGVGHQANPQGPRKAGQQRRDRGAPVPTQSGLTPQAWSNLQDATWHHESRRSRARNALGPFHAPERGVRRDGPAPLRSAGQPSREAPEVSPGRSTRWLVTDLPSAGAMGDSFRCRACEQLLTICDPNTESTNPR